MKNNIISLFVLLRCAHLAGAANWAQVVGSQQQSIVMPARPGFAPRWGHTAVTLTMSSGEELEVQEEVLVLGGETTEGHYQNKKIVSETIAGVHHDGTRGYRNDVQVASTYRWLRYADRIERTKYNNPVPKVEGQMEWSVRNEGFLPPSDHSYDEWITCDYDAWEDVHRSGGGDDGAKPRFVDPHAAKYREGSRYKRDAATGEALYECDPVESPFAGPASFFTVGACPAHEACTMWSPRRGHATVVQGSTIIVLGGRAREHVRMRRDEAVGGVLTLPVANDKFYSAWREKTVLKNDVWRSEDRGASWELQNPGCRSPQPDLVHAAKARVTTRVGRAGPGRGGEGDGRTQNGGEKSTEHLVVQLPYFGAEDDQCASDADCYGDASCRTLEGKQLGASCMCDSWSPREHHAAAVHNWGADAGGVVVYLGGGFASKRQRNCGSFACGDWDAAGSYRVYMNDFWRSTDSGETWTMLSVAAPWEGRGGHSMVSFEGYLWVFNGQGQGGHGRRDRDAQGNYGPAAGADAMNRGSAGQHHADEVVYFADQWRLSRDSGDADAWDNDLGLWSRRSGLGPGTDDAFADNGTVPPWPARFGHSTVVEEASLLNSDQTYLFLSGGRDGDGFLGDVWSWKGLGYNWVKDYSQETLQRHYLDRDSKVQQLQNVVPNNNKYANPTTRRENLTTPADLRLLHGEGIHTVGDLADAEPRTILRLRGFDLPQVEDRLAWSEEKGGADGVCYAYALAKALVSKCHDIDVTIGWVDGEKQRPVNQKGEKHKVHRNSRNARLRKKRVSLSHKSKASSFLRGGNTDYDEDDDDGDGGGGGENEEEEEDDEEEWDGCSYLDMEGDTVDVNSIGDVPQMENPWKYNVQQQVDEIACKVNPFPRAFHTSVYFDQQIWVMGGKRAVTDATNDVWYRDNLMPLAVLNDYPDTGSSDALFTFKSNKDGVQYEFMVYFGDRLEVLRPWSRAFGSEDVGWLKHDNDIGEDSNTNTEKGDQQGGNSGPGHGNYIFYVRALDPAGNVDLNYDAGRNMYTWRYTPAPPVVTICLILFILFASLCWVGYEYHKYLRQLALERYAIKRIRRKFKGMMADGADRTDAKSLLKGAKGKKKKGKKDKKKKKKKKDKKKRGGKEDKHKKKKKKNKKEKRGKDGKKAKSGGGKKQQKKKNKKEEKKKPKKDKKEKKKKNDKDDDKSKSKTNKEKKDKDKSKNKIKKKDQEAAKQRTAGADRKGRSKSKAKDGEKKSKAKKSNKSQKEKKKALKKSQEAKRKKGRSKSPARKKKD